MKTFTLVLIAVISIANAAKDDKDKRAAQTTKLSPDVAYATAKVTPQTFSREEDDQQQYIRQQVQYAPANYKQEQQYLQQYSQPGKATAQPIQYSLASDVSSFSYQSPVVSYSNQGLLKQTIGNYQSAPEPKQAPQRVVYRQQQYTQPQEEQQVQYVPRYVYKSQAQAQAQPQEAYQQAQSYQTEAQPTYQQVAYKAQPQAQVAYQSQPVYYRAQTQSQAQTAPVQYVRAVPAEAYQKYIAALRAQQEQQEQAGAYSQPQQQYQYVRYTPTTRTAGVSYA